VIARSFKAILMAIVVAMLAVVMSGVAHTPEREAEARGGGAGYGKKIVDAAKRKIGVPYGWDRGEMVCTELTSHAVGRATGIYMPINVRSQKRYGYQPRTLRRGDVVFFDENGPAGPDTHVAIYAGRGMIIHASNFFGQVARSEMRYVEGYSGARRVRP
jgi:cell wall-associated NlpC family hydrolase